MEPNLDLHPRIAVFGDAMVDYVMQLPSGSSHDEKVTARRSSRRLGGTGANAAATMRLLSSSVELVATVSSDPLGEWLIQELRAIDVGVDRVARVAGTVPQATILLADEGRRVIIDRGVADEPALPTREWIEAHDLVYISNPVPVLPQLPGALGIPVVVGVEHQMIELLSRRPGPLLAADIVITNEAGWRDFSELLAASAVVLETRGARGVVIHSRGASHPVLAVPADVVDETGAGDAFAGSFCHYLAAGHPLLEAVQRGVVVASLTVEVAEPHLITLRAGEIDTLWKRHFGTLEGNEHDNDLSLGRPAR